MLKENLRTRQTLRTHAPNPKTLRPKLRLLETINGSCLQRNMTAAKGKDYASTAARSTCSKTATRQKMHLRLSVQDPTLQSPKVRILKSLYWLCYFEHGTRNHSPAHDRTDIYDFSEFYCLPPCAHRLRT